MADAPLQPIVIPAIVCGPFECLGNGLLYEGVEREQPKTLKDLLAPTKSSKRAAIEDRERPKKWWRAQCLHYGLPAPASASISTYRAHLENAVRQRGGLKQPQELVDLEFEQNGKFRRLNSEVRDATSGVSQFQVTKPKGKAKAEPKPKAEIDAGPSTKATSSKKRKAETVIHVYHHDGDRLPTVPVNNEAVKRSPTKKARAAVPSPPAPAPIFNTQPSYSQAMSQQAATNQTIRKGIPGMFSGTYELDCTSEENWPSYEKPTLRVFMSKSGRPWFKALLILPNFLTCFLRPRPNVTWAEDGYIRFEWCGREEGDGEIEAPSESNVGWLKMHKAEGRVKGMIQTTFGEFLFQGPRVDADPPTIEYEWEDFSWDAYNHANHARW